MKDFFEFSEYSISDIKEMEYLFAVVIIDRCNE